LDLPSPISQSSQNPWRWQEQHGSGKAIVETLSKDIRKEFPGISGYSPDNLWRLCQFYLEYSDTQILGQLVPELVQLVKREGKTTMNKFLFLEQPFSVKIR
jgi:hypothetical protein